MAGHTYPTTLPAPRTLSYTPRERRQLGDAQRPLQARVLERDRGAVERVTWPPFTPAQSQVFNAWWKDGLVYGGAWFAATWPTPQGRVPLVLRFRAPPLWQYVAGGFWNVSADVEVRGAGELPTPCFTETFAGGLSAYTRDVGSAPVFAVASSPYGQSLVIGPQSGGSDTISRSLGRTLRAVGTLSCKFMVDSFAADDGGELGLMSSGVRVLAFGPRVAAGLDAARRAVLQLDTEDQFATDASVEEGEWYSLDVTIAAEASSATITKLSDDTIVGFTTFALSHSPHDVQRLQWHVDSSSTTNVMHYADVHFCET